jgi:hypothetical protein
MRPNSKLPLGSKPQDVGLSPDSYDPCEPGILNGSDQSGVLSFNLIVVGLFLLRIGTRCLRFWPDMMIAMSGHVPILAAFLRRLAGDLSLLWRL